MTMSTWNKKGATLSDKSACKEFGISQQEIIQAINEGKLQYRQNHIHGNPYLRLLREEVEDLVIEKRGLPELVEQEAAPETTKPVVTKKIIVPLGFCVIKKECTSFDL